jgi:rSAM/selenodomain-associated transferase 2
MERLAVVIPTCNEAPRIAAAVESAFAAGADEVIVSDSSCDATAERAATAGANVISGERHRGRQIQRALDRTTAPLFLILHADTLLPLGAADAARAAISDGAGFGGFRLRFIEDDVQLRIAAGLINARTALTRCPWGDQAQFGRRDLLSAAGGVPDLPLMEDYELARRMRRVCRSVLLRETVLTSGRRFLDRGLIATMVRNWTIVTSYHLGVEPAELERLYRVQ